jgi:hypothetical protein
MRDMGVFFTVNVPSGPGFFQNFHHAMTLVVVSCSMFTGFMGPQMDYLPKSMEDSLKSSFST